MAAPYISEVSYRDNDTLDFIEVVVDAGTDVSNIQLVVYDQTGSIASVSNLTNLSGTQSGSDIYTFESSTSSTFDGIHKNGSIALVVDGVVTQYFTFDESGTSTPATEGPAAGLTPTNIGSAGSGESLETTDGGATYVTQPNPTPGTIPCFLAGTMIETPSKLKLVENLVAGDTVTTDGGRYQTITWVGQKHFNTCMAPDSEPICIPQNAFGLGRPFADLYVSPNHRIVVQGPQIAVMLENFTGLIAAKHLVGLNGIHIAKDIEDVHYIHLLFESHQILRSNGLRSESFHPGQQILDGFGAYARRELLALFPELATDCNAYGPLALPELKGFEAKLIRDVLAA